MIEFESFSLKTPDEHVDVVKAVSLELDAKMIGIFVKSRKRPVANLALPPSATHSFANICRVSCHLWERTSKLIFRNFWILQLGTCLIAEISELARLRRQSSVCLESWLACDRSALGTRLRAILFSFLCTQKASGGHPARAGAAAPRF